MRAYCIRALAKPTLDWTRNCGRVLSYATVLLCSPSAESSSRDCILPILECFKSSPHVCVFPILHQHYRFAQGHVVRPAPFATACPYLCLDYARFSFLAGGFERLGVTSTWCEISGHRCCQKGPRACPSVIASSLPCLSCVSRF